jgi:hypothetical protein
MLLTQFTIQAGRESYSQFSDLLTFYPMLAGFTAAGIVNKPDISAVLFVGGKIPLVHAGDIIRFGIGGGGQVADGNQSPPEHDLLVLTIQ